MADKTALHALIAQRKVIESEIDALSEVLSSSGVGMTGALVDEEGFPYNNIDVHSIRIARNRIVRLQNDYKVIMIRIEEALHHLHISATTAAAAVDADAADIESHSHSNNITNMVSDMTTFIAFLYVDDVAPMSPAATAGLRNGDHILKFGSMQSGGSIKDSTTALRAVGDIVRSSNNEAIDVLVERGDNNAISLTLTPSHWSGPGLLGCRLRALDKTADISTMEVVPR